MNGGHDTGNSITAAGSARLPTNIVRFARALRRAGVPVGPAAVVDAIAGVQRTGVTLRADFYWTLHAFFVNRRDHHAVFDAVFRGFWRVDYASTGREVDEFGGSDAGEPPAPAERRAGEALADSVSQTPAPQAGTDQLVRLAAAHDSLFRNMDFVQMSADEIAEAKRSIARLRLPADSVVTRRLRPARRGMLDPRCTLRVSLSQGGGLIVPQFRARSSLPPPIVALCDVSGSMRGYSRIVLHFLHTLSARRRRVRTFVFGTKLSNITRPLSIRDPDAALAACGVAVDDWAGGTRIGDVLRDFNYTWSRRVLGQGATVLLITDGLERGPANLLAKQMDRLHRSCRRLIWLNPLLRFEGFQAKAAGIREMLPHVDEFRTVHSLASLSELVDALGNGGTDLADPRHYLNAA